QIEIAAADALQQADRVIAADLDPPVAGLPPKRADDRAQGLSRDVWNPQPKTMQRILRSAGDDQLVVDGQQAAGGLQRLLAPRGEIDAGGLLLDQVAAQQRFQLSHVRADGGLRQLEQLRRLGEAAELVDRNERPQQLGRNVDLALPEARLGAAVRVEDDIGP